MCFVPHLRALVAKLSSQKCLTVDWGGFNIFTSTGALRHSHVHFYGISTSKIAPRMECLKHFGFHICFARQRLAIFHLSSPQMAPHPPLLRAYFSTRRSHNTLEKHRVFVHLLAHLHLLSSDSFSSLIFLILLSLLWLFPPLLLHLSIMSGLPNFLRSLTYTSHTNTIKYIQSKSIHTRCSLRPWETNKKLHPVRLKNKTDQGRELYNIP